MDCDLSQLSNVGWLPIKSGAKGVVPGAAAALGARDAALLGEAALDWIFFFQTVTENYSTGKDVPSTKEAADMYCQTCGTALATQMKYCNRCGAHLVTIKEDDTVKLFEKRMDSEMEGLFWITVLGLALILGGMALMKKVQLSESLIVAYMILGSAAFMAYFGLGVWQVRRLNRSSKEAMGRVQQEGHDTNALGPAKAWPTLEAGSSVTEQTTRGLKRVLGTMSRD